jgi:restriction system protein
MIDDMEGHDFEEFCADLLRRNGFEEVEVTQGSGDQGVDILAQKDDIRYAIQCKNYHAKLGNTPVQEIYAGKTYYHCHVGVVMTNSVFTQSAVDLADATNIILWDREKLQKFIDNG